MYGKIGVKSPKYGQKLNPEQILNLKKSHEQYSIKIICHQNEKIYHSINDAALDLKIHKGHISEHLKGKRKRVNKTYTFSFFQ